MSEPKKDGSMLANALAIIGFIILIIVIVWGLIHLASLSDNWFSSFWTKKADTAITVTAPASVVSGTPARITWKYTSSAKGSYAFLYQCDTGVQISASASSNNTLGAIPCGTAYTLGTATSSLVMLPVSTATSSVSLPLSILFIPSEGAAQAQGSAVVAITPHVTRTTTSTKKLGAAPTHTTPTTAADLSVRIISLHVDQYGNGTAVFDVTNNGGSYSGSYYFTAQLPTTQPYTYTSPAQTPLSGSSHIVSTLNFTQAMSGTFQVQISGGNDSYYGNNSASQYLTVNNYNYQYQPVQSYQNQYYPQYQYPQYNQYPQYQYNQYPYTY